LTANVPRRRWLGQLQEAGNTTTLAHCLRLLETAFLVSGLERFSAGRARSRGSSLKLVLWNNALPSAVGLRSFAQARSEPDRWGRQIENAVGAHLLNHVRRLPYEVTY
jgi:predicted AAA+ superfamily ATPase